MIINGVDIDVEKLLDEKRGSINVVKEIMEVTGCSLNKATSVVEEVINEKRVHIEHEVQCKSEKELISMIDCPCCNKKISNQAFSCPSCGHPLNVKSYCEEEKTEFSEATSKEEFKGVYRYTLFGGKQEVYCPRCDSADCSHYKEQKVIPGKTKTRYSANLNPLRPFTFVNKKEKVVRQEQIVTEDRFMCNSCGKIFD